MTGRLNWCDLGRQIRPHLILAVQKIHRRSPTHPWASSYRKWSFAHFTASAFSFTFPALLLYLPRSPSAAGAGDLAVEGEDGRELEGHAVCRDPGSCGGGGVPSGLGDSFAVPLIEAQFEPFF